MINQGQVDEKPDGCGNGGPGGKGVDGAFANGGKVVTVM